MPKNTRRKLGNALYGNIPTDSFSEHEFLSGRGVNMTEKVIFRLGFQDEVQDLGAAQIIVQDAVGRQVRDQDVQVVRDVGIGDGGVAGDGADNHAVAVFDGVLQDRDAVGGHCLLNGVGLPQFKRQFVIPRDKDLPFRRKRGEPRYEIIVLISFEVVLDSIAGTNDDIRPLRHLQLTMMPVGVGEGEDGMATKY